MAGQPLGRFLPNPKLRLKEQFHEVCRFRHVAVRTEESYWGWVVRLVRFFDSKVNPRDMNGEQLKGFLTYLASVEKVAASTQNQALNALMFLYREVLHLERVVTGFERVRRPGAGAGGVVAGGDPAAAGGGGAGIWFASAFALRDGNAADGVIAVAGERCGF